MLFHRFLQESPKRTAKTASIGRQGRDAGPYPVPSGKQMESSVKVSLPNFVAGATWWSKLHNSAISLS